MPSDGEPDTKSAPSPRMSTTGMWKKGSPFTGRKSSSGGISDDESKGERGSEDFHHSLTGEAGLWRGDMPPILEGEEKRDGWEGEGGGGGELNQRLLAAMKQVLLNIFEELVADNAELLTRAATLARQQQQQPQQQQPQPASPSQHPDSSGYIYVLVRCIQLQEYGPDFAEIALPVSPEERTMELFRAELEREFRVPQGRIIRIRKLPNIVICRDAHLARLVGQEKLELVLQSE